MLPITGPDPRLWRDLEILQRKIVETMAVPPHLLDGRSSLRSSASEMVRMQEQTLARMIAETLGRNL